MDKKKFSVSVVIPNYNGVELLKNNLPKILFAKENQENCISEITIVDDGSTDESAKYIKDNFPQIKLIKHKTRRGFSASVNMGVRSSKGNLVLLLNNDVAPEKNFLAPALKHFDNSDVFAVSLHEKGYGWATGSFKDGYIEIGMGGEGNEAHRSFYVNGGSGIFRKDVWMNLGGMDEKLLSPFYWEDIDLCFRAAKRGFVSLWEPDGRIVHDHESTISKFPASYVNRIKERNQLLVIWKNIQSANLIRRHIAGLTLRLLRHPGYIRILFMALSKLGMVLRLRKREFKESKVSDETVFSRFSG